MRMRLTGTSVTLSRQDPKRLSHAGIETTIFRFGMRSVNLFIKLSGSLLRETTRDWLLQLYLPNLTGSKQIDDPNHTLVKKHGMYSTTLLVGHDTLLITVSSQLLHLSWLEMGNTRLLIASHLDLSLKKCLTFGGPQHQTQ